MRKLFAYWCPLELYPNSLQMVLIWNLLLCFPCSLYFNRTNLWDSYFKQSYSFPIFSSEWEVCLSVVWTQLQPLKSVCHAVWKLYQSNLGAPKLLWATLLCAAPVTPLHLALCFIVSCWLCLPAFFLPMDFHCYLHELQRLQTQQWNRLLSPSCYLEHQNFPSQF